MKGSFVRKAIADLKRRPVRSQAGDAEGLKELGRSYLKRPVHPILCRPDFTVADGHRRLEGLLLVGETEVTVFVTDEDLTDDDLTEVGLISAMHRQDLAPIDEARACKALMERSGATARVLAGKLDCSESKISRLLAVFKTNENVLKAAEDGRIGPKAWAQIALVNAADMDGLLNMYLSGMPAAQIEAVRRKPKATTERVTKVRIPLAVKADGVAVNGVVTVAGPPGRDIDFDEAERILREAARAIREAVKAGLGLKAAQASWKDMAAAKKV